MAYMMHSSHESYMRINDSRRTLESKKRDYILQKRPVLLRSLLIVLIVATSYTWHDSRRTLESCHVYEVATISTINRFLKIIGLFCAWHTLESCHEDEMESCLTRTHISTRLWRCSSMVMQRQRAITRNLQVWENLWQIHACSYVVASISRLLQSIGLFCRM